jgi:hypothetical protein
MITVSSRLRTIIDEAGAVILDVERDTMLTLNATAAYAWSRLQQGRELDEIIRDLASETGADPALVADDVKAFVDQLRSKQLISTSTTLP